MVKQLKQRYIFKCKSYTLPELEDLAKYQGSGNIKGSIIIRTKKHNIPVKIVFVQNRNNKCECLYILSTNCGLSDEEIIRIYGNRWGIETFFKASKSLLKLEKEFQSRDYTAIICHTSIVFTRYIILEWIKRNENYEKTFGELFFMMCYDVKDMDFVTAIQSLYALLNTMGENLNYTTADLKNKLTEWVASQQAYIRDFLVI